MKKGKLAVIVGTVLTIAGAYMWYLNPTVSMTGITTPWLVLSAGAVIWIIGDYQAGIYK